MVNKRGQIPFITLFCACLLLSGCAAVRFPSVYKVEGKEVKDFKELDDDKALKLVTLIYNVKHDVWEEGIARSIALEQYINLLAKRKSKYIRSSGIFGVTYDKVKLASWPDEDLEKLYDTIEPKASAYYVDAAPDLSDIQNAERIMYLTAMSAVEAEMKSRGSKRTAVALAGNILIGALSIAMAML
jgi:hypothetical protein